MRILGLLDDCSSTSQCCRKKRISSKSDPFRRHFHRKKTLFHPKKGPHFGVKRAAFFDEISLEKKDRSERKRANSHGVCASLSLCRSNSLSTQKEENARRPPPPQTAFGVVGATRQPLHSIYRSVYGANKTFVRSIYSRSLRGVENPFSPVSSLMLWCCDKGGMSKISKVSFFFLGLSLLYIK